MYAETGRLQHAVGYYQDALAINRTARRRSGQATNLLNLGNLQIELGRIGAAGECYTEALELARLEGNTVREGRGLHGLAGVLHTQGHLDAARDHYARSLELFGDIGDLRGASLGEIADVECDIGDIEGARRHAEDAILLAHEFGSRYDEAHALNTLAMVEHRLGHADAAAATFRRALRLAEQSQVSTAQIVALRGIAISTARGNPTQAMEHADHALALARTNGMRLLEAVALTARSAAECWTDPTRAIETVGSALSILNGCGARLHEARARATLGAALAADGDGAAARAQWHGALAVFTECGAAPEADGVRALLN
jgi:tetratricopeptide (TPR) repeat protein